MAAWTGKTYVFDHAENFEAFAQALGLPKPPGNPSGKKITLELSKDGDQYHFYNVLPNRVVDHKFKSGQAFDEKLTGDITVKTTFTFESPNKLVQVQKGTKVVNFVYNFTDSDLVIDSSVGDVSAKAFYKV